MNATQKTYAVAKAQYETTLRAYTEYMQPYQHLLDGSDNAIEQYIDIEMSCPYNTTEAMKVLTEAENAMVEWAMSKVSKIAYLGEEKNAVEICRNRGMKHYNIRKELVDIAFRLA